MALVRPVMLSAMLRGEARRILDSTGLLDASRAVQRRAWLVLDPRLREHDRLNRAAFPAFRDRYSTVLRDRLNAGARALVIGCRCPTLESELAIVKALQLGGYDPTIVVRDSYRGLRPYYQLARVAGVHTWSEFSGPSADLDGAAARILDRCGSVEDLLAIEHDGVRVGRIALSTSIRQRRVGVVDLQDKTDREDLQRRVMLSLAAVREAARLLDRIDPSLVLFVDTEYSPTGELFDLCLARGVPAVAYDAGHRSNTLVFKRYTTANRRDHLSTLSRETWDALRTTALTDAQRLSLDRELTDGYQTGDWYRACWTQAHAHSTDAQALRDVLGLRPNRKAAFIFAHILWDAPLSWAPTLFPTYEEWLVQTVRAATRNTDVDWFIKIHPANQGKQAKEGYAGEPTETRVLRAALGDLPSHVRILPPSFDVSTASLFRVMDYCLTVRGTVGVEAARLGIPVLTAGPGRYGGLGFTIDSSGVDEYLTRLHSIQHVEALSDGQRTLAERYAYAFFMMKPFSMTSVTWDYGRLGDRTTATIHVKDGAGWREAPDILRLSRWLSVSSDEDFIDTSSSTTA